MKLKLQPPSVLLMGEPGSGKTDSLATWLEAGLELFVIVTEPDGAASLIDSITRRKLDINKVHWSSCLPASTGLKAMFEMTRTIGSMSFEQIQSIKSGVGKDQTRTPAMHLLQQLENFTCDRTGENYGSFTDWDDTRVLAIDSLSGLSMMSHRLTTGYKPAAHQGEWGVSQNWIENLLFDITADRRCFFTLTSHIERETNEIHGNSRIMPSTLGRKLPGKIPRFFSEVVYAKRQMKDNTAEFIWATVDMVADLKNRSLPISPNLKPSFVPVAQAYTRRLDQAALPPVSKEVPKLAEKPQPQTQTRTGA